MGDYTYQECITPARKNLHIIGASERLFTAEIKMAKLKHKEHVLSKRLANLQGYDFVFVDCGPSINISNQILKNHYKNYSKNMLIVELI